MTDNAFLRAFNFIASSHIEGELSLDPDDAGNWTGGEKGKGELRGTKFGISAKAYPHLDIKSLSLSQARDIYERDYWTAAMCDRLPPRLAFVHFAFHLNTRPEYAAKCLQAAVGVARDGVIGPVTLRAAKRMDQNESVPNYLAEQALYYTKFKTFPEHGRGWLERVVRTAMEAAK